MQYRNKGSPARMRFKGSCVFPHVMYCSPREIALSVQECPDEHAFARRSVLLFRILEL